MAMTALIIGLGGSGVWTALHVKKQLMDAYGNRVPSNVSIAVFDTEKRASGYRLGNPDDGVRQPGMGTGAVKLDDSEFAFIGGDAFGWANEMARGEKNSLHPYWHIRRWFLLERFLRDLPQSTWQLDQGAGQFRQLGRLAMFRDVQAPSQSAIAAVIDNKLRTLLGSATTAIPVVITGSIVGGTGAGFFIDLAHLVRRVAAAVGGDTKVNLRGFFYTPDAFLKTLNGQELVTATPRAFAALRELRRFILNEDYQFGYPMDYHSPTSGVDANIWRSTAKGKLYDYVYLIDGHNSNPAMKLNSHLLKDGSAAAVADAIVSFVDDQYGPKQEAYEVNTKGKIQDRQGQVGKLAFISTLGSYSIILPMEQIIESWSHRLAGDVLDVLAPAGAYTMSGYVQALSATANPEAGSRQPIEEVRRLLTSGTEIVDTRYPDRRVVRPLPLGRNIFDMHHNVEAQNPDSVLRVLSTLDLRQWLDMLVPPQLERDVQTTNLMNQTGATLRARFPDMVLPSDERKPAGNAATDWTEIRNRAQTFIDQQLGTPATGGGRQGGIYRDALTRFVGLQVERFRDYTSLYIAEVLNGQAEASDAEAAKHGKLGWLLAVMSTMADVFSETYSLLERLRTGTGSNQLKLERQSVEDGYSSALKAMQDKREDTGGMLRFGRAEAYKTQTAFINATQEYVDLYRKEFARDAVAEATRQIAGVLRNEILPELTLWADVLALHAESLHRRMKDGLVRIQTERARAADVKNHRIIHDAEWEAQQYEEKVNRGSETAKSRFFRAWAWETPLPGSNQAPRFALRVRLAGQEIRKDVNRPNWSSENQQTLLEFARATFRDALREETILNYLMTTQYARNADALGEELARTSGYLLDFTRTNASAGAITGNIILAKHDGSKPDQVSFLRQALNKLAALKGLGDISGQNSPTQQIVDCANPFRLTILSTLELLPLEDTKAWRDGKDAYQATPVDTRQKNHIFAAEVRAVEYEAAFYRTLKQNPSHDHDGKPRLMVDRVCLLLEDEARFIQFLSLWAHRLITVADDQSTGSPRTYWALVAPFEDPRYRTQLDEWKLTSAQTTDPADEVMEAVIRFVNIGADADNQSKLIPYPHVQKYLTAVVDHEMTQRLQNDDLALDDPELRTWMDAFLPPLDANGQEDLSNWTPADDDLKIKVARSVTRHDALRTLADQLKDVLPQFIEEAKAARQQLDGSRAVNEAIKRQELADLYSVAVVALENELKRYREIVQQDYTKRTGGTRVSGVGRRR